jgi:hypothetical protein
MNNQNEFKKNFPQAIRLSWEEVEDLLWKVFLDMKGQGYDPDVVIGVARGGLAPARILMDFLQKKYICTFQMGRRDPGGGSVIPCAAGKRHPYGSPGE